jgi:asparaginyl-tRNA synthetase
MTVEINHELQTRHLRIGGDPAWVEQRQQKAAALRAIRSYLDEEGFTEVEPIPGMTTLTGACENLDTLWGPYDYYGDSFFLPQTGQPLLELLISEAIPRVYTINQSFRQETTQFGRRLACFNMLEVEMKDASLKNLQNILHGIVCRAFAAAGAGSMSDVSAGWEVVTYADAVGRLKQDGAPIEWGQDLGASHEHYLAKNGPVFITEYPRHLKFFNAAPIEGSDDLTQSMDLLLPGVGETAGCTVREHRPHVLAKQLHDYAYEPKRREDIKKLGLTGPEALKDAYNWYLGKPSMPHAGFGVGLARLWQYLFRQGDITSVVDFPRIKGLLLP